jgi:4-hydroxy-3-polyprenylbenzoate decarboxylase
MTGASGHHYAERLVQALVRGGHQVDLALTEAGCKVLRHERGIDAGVGGERLEARLAGWLGEDVAEEIRCFTADAVESPACSGSSGTVAVILCPCSMGTLARVAAGFSSNLVERAADVALKEGRELVLVPRETPMSEIHLENLLRLARMGAAVLPAMPGFYHAPRTILDLVDHVVGKVLDRLGVDHALFQRWDGQLAEDPGTEPTR